MLLSTHIIGVLVNHQTEPVLFPNFDLHLKCGENKVGQRKNLTNHSDFFFHWLRLVPYYSVPCSHLFDQIHVARLPDISLDNQIHLRIILPQSFLHVERAAHPGISGRRLKDVCTVNDLATPLATAKQVLLS